jgi:hypothetical protein
LLCNMSSMQKRSQILLWPPPDTAPPSPLSPQNECFENWSTQQSKVVWDASTGRKEGLNKQYFMRIRWTCTLPSLGPKPKTCNHFRVISCALDIHVAPHICTELSKLF